METKITFIKKSDVVSYPEETDVETTVSEKSITLTGKNGRVTFNHVEIPIRPMMYVETLAAQGMTISQAIHVMQEQMLLLAGENFMNEIKKMFND